MKMRLETDLSLFNNGMIQVKSAVVVGSKAGMQQAMEEFREDAFTIPPTVPYKDGALKEAHEIRVESVLGGVRGMLEVVEVRQAASLHEGISRHGTPYKKWTTPGSGSHWLSSKLLMFKDEYVRKVAAGIRQAFRIIKVRGHFRHFGTTWVQPHLRKIRIR